jgi:splicing factor 45
MTSPPPPPRGLSLYENLHDPNDASKSSATISSAPVLYNQADGNSTESPAKKPIDPALRFQPIRRPQAKQSKPKPSFPKPAAPKPTPTVTAPPAAPPAPAQPKSTLADWAVTEEDAWRYGAVEKRQRGGRKNKKKKHQMQMETDWDELYDPARPTNVEEYLRSEEKIDEVREWKSLLYRHRRKRNESDLSDEDEEDARHVPSSKSLLLAARNSYLHPITDQFAPPPSYSNVPPPPRSPPASSPDDQVGENVFARRQAMSRDQQPPPPPPGPPPEQPPFNSATISRAPVRYTQPEESKDNDYDEGYSPPPVLGGSASNADAEARSTRPGQAGFAHRLMNKYGWTKGSGLGADETGIINPLQVQVDKRRKKADADGGGWAESGGKGKIIGGQRKEESTGKFGIMSDVIVLQNMLENLPDLQAEIADGLGQEIGEECGEKVLTSTATNKHPRPNLTRLQYGRVERLYIEQDSRQVFIKFTNQVSALRVRPSSCMSNLKFRSSHILGRK